MKEDLEMVNRERREGRAQSSCGEEEGRNAEVSGMCQDFDHEVYSLFPCCDLGRIKAT